MILNNRKEILNILPLMEICCIPCASMSSHCCVPSLINIQSRISDIKMCDIPFRKQCSFDDVLICFTAWPQVNFNSLDPGLTCLMEKLEQSSLLKTFLSSF